MSVCVHEPMRVTPSEEVLKSPFYKSLDGAIMQAGDTEEGVVRIWMCKLCKVLYWSKVETDEQ